MMRNSWLSLGLLLFLLLAPAAGLAVGSPSEMLPDTAQESRAEAIGSQLRCLVCQNESIEDSGADLARDLRHVVRVHVAQGESNRQIIAWMVERYGNFIRLQPPFNAMTLLLWGMPLLALALGGMAAGFAWRTRRVAPPPLTESEHRRLADLLEHS